MNRNPLLLIIKVMLFQIGLLLRSKSNVPVERLGDGEHS
ncbi:hypothetical protein AHF37_08656 [Paragonimus kellicotti]|nr:hypothetical protein AHF37_08656 [Paragonimus kellicotti]